MPAKSFLMLLLLACPAPAAEYTFTRIAYTAPGSRFRSFGRNILLINKNGVVAFTAELRDGTTGIFTVSGGEVKPLFIEDSNHRNPRATAIDDAGRVVFARGVVNAASFSADDAVSPGAVVSLFGSDLATKLTVAGTGVLPTTLDDVQVTVNGATGPLFFVSQAQINIQMPYEVSGSSAEIRVVTANGASDPVAIRLAAHSPGVYRLNRRGDGQAAVFQANTSSLAAPGGLTSDSRPARPGDIGTLYVNGMGDVDPPVASGFNSCRQGLCASDLSNVTLRRATVPPVLEIGGVRVPDADILFAGLAPQFPGLYQINFRVLSGVRGSAAAAIAIRQGSAAGRGGIAMAVQ